MKKNKFCVVNRRGTSRNQFTLYQKNVLAILMRRTKIYRTVLCSNNSRKQAEDFQNVPVKMTVNIVN